MSRPSRTRWKKLKEILWPSMGFNRLARYYRHRMGRLPGTPYFIAAGFATGVAVSFTPFIGFHLLTAGIITWLLRGSMTAMILGTVIAGNPWSFPFIWVGTYELGSIMLGQAEVHPILAQGFTFRHLLEKPLELLLPMTLGSVPFVFLSWVASFLFVRHLIKRYKKVRNARIHGIRKNR